MADFIATVLRADDLLSLTFEFFNLKLDQPAGQPPRLVRVDAAQPAFLVVVLPPQHIAETAYPLDPVSGTVSTTDLTPVPAAMSRSFMAGPSRLGFRVPDSLPSLPFTLAALLDWEQFVPSLAANALPDPPDLTAGQPRPASPTDQQTALELPYRLLLSPVGPARWSHATEAVTHQGVTELWHTRLGTADATDPSVPPPLRAIWTDDLDGPAHPAATQPEDHPPFANDVLTATDRREIVTNSADFAPPGAGGPVAAPALRASHLTLSPLGAWADLQGSWDGTADSELQSWRHTVAQGRDQQVRIVRMGSLFPLGHRAALVEVFDRQLAVGERTADFLTGTSWIAVLESERDYDQPALADRTALLPLRQVRITTKAVPVGPDAGPVPFHLLGRDRSGTSVDFQLPLLFVGVDTPFEQALSQYGELGAAELDSPRLRLAPAADSILPVQQLTFSAQSFDDLTPPYLPQVPTAVVRIPAIDQLLGSAELVLPQEVRLLAATAASEAFATLTTPLSVAVPTDRAGGLATPTFSFDSLTGALGPVPAGFAQLATGGVTADSLLGNAPLLGGITLAKVIGELTENAHLPTLQQTVSPQGVTTSAFDWQPPLGAPQLLLLSLTGDSKLSIHGSTTVSPSPSGQPGEPMASVSGELTHFALDFAKVLTVHFGSLQFTSGTGQKTTVVPVGVRVTFEEELSLLNELAKIIPTEGFGGLPQVRLTPAGVTVSYSLGLPSAGVAVFSLANIVLTAVLTLPFDGTPVRLRLAFSERGHPFLVTVSMVGGGGFLAIEVDSTGLRALEGEIELGANLEVSLAVVTASVHVTGGFYFSLTEGVSKSMAFSAYLRIGGAVELLGIAGVSIEIYLAMTYEPDRNPPSIGGRATVSVGVHLLMLTKHITLSTERHFAIPGGQPPPQHLITHLQQDAALPAANSFEQLVTPADWTTYCQAFA